VAAGPVCCRTRLSCSPYKALIQPNYAQPAGTAIVRGQDDGNPSRRVDQGDECGFRRLSCDPDIGRARAHQRLSHAWRQAIMNGSQRAREQIHAAGRVEKGFGATPGKMGATITS
jgi:hypothetical protein